MSELCDSLSIVFTDSAKIEDHLFAKAIRWADQNPGDKIFWARKKALEKIPDIDVDWSLKIRALRRICFGYSMNKYLLHGCIDEAIKANMDSEIAAIICSLSLPKNCSQIGSLLAALASFCQGNDGRAVVVIDLREDEETEEENNHDEADSFENVEFLEEEKWKAGTSNVKKSEDDESKDEFLKKLKIVSAMYTKNVLVFDGEKFSNCF